MPLYGLSLNQLADQASEMNLLDDFRALDPFIYIEVNEARYVLDASMARTFLLGLINGAQCRQADKRILSMPAPAQTREPLTRVRG